MRCLVVINALQVGGAARQLQSVAPRLRRDGIDVTVVHYDGTQTQMLESFVQAGIRTIGLDKNAVGRVGFVRQLAALVRRERFDLVHAWEGTANIYGRLAAVLGGAPVVVGGLRAGTSFDHPALAVPNSALNPWTTGWVVNAPRLSEVVRTRLAGTHGHRFYVVPNGLEALSESAYRAGEVTRYDKARRRRFVVGAVGRCTRIKNHAMFFRAAARVARARDDVEFWLIGGGELMQEYREMVARLGVQDRVKLWGETRDVDVAMYRMDMTVLTSDSEGCPNVLLEAMRAGRPLVSTRCTDMANIVEEGRNGYTVALGEDEALAERILYIVAADNSERERFGIESRRLFEEHFTVERSAARLADAYRDSISR